MLSLILSKMPMECLSLRVGQSRRVTETSGRPEFAGATTTAAGFAPAGVVDCECGASRSPDLSVDNVASCGWGRSRECRYRRSRAPSEKVALTTNSFGARFVTMRDQF